MLCRCVVYAPISRGNLIMQTKKKGQSFSLRSMFIGILCAAVTQVPSLSHTIEMYHVCGCGGGSGTYSLFTIHI